MERREGRNNNIFLILTLGHMDNKQHLILFCHPEVLHVSLSPGSIQATHSSHREGKNAYKSGRGRGKAGQL